jgi:hypothetical protein
MQYVAHYFSRLSESLRSIRSVAVAGETVEEAHASAVAVLPHVANAIGFRLCDLTDRQVDIHVPNERIGAPQSPNG